jgi:hypothetical protein
MIPAVAAMVGRVAGGAAAKAGAGKTGQIAASYAGRTAAFTMGKNYASNNGIDTTSASAPKPTPSREAGYESTYIDTGR